MSLIVMELRARAAALRVRALDNVSLAYPLETHASQARRNRRKNRDWELADQYDHIADLAEKENE